MRPPPREEIVKLFTAWWTADPVDHRAKKEAFIAGYELCWRQFNEFVKSEVGSEKIRKRYPPLDIGREHDREG